MRHVKGDKPQMGAPENCIFPPPELVEVPPGEEPPEDALVGLYRAVPPLGPWLEEGTELFITGDSTGNLANVKTLPLSKGAIVWEMRCGDTVSEI